MSNKILVVGASGNTGCPLVKELVNQGECVKAATRSLETYRGAVGDGVEVIPFDLNDPATQSAALEGTNRLYLLAPPEAEMDADRLLIAFMVRAREAGVSRVVLMTAMGVEHAPPDFGLRRVELHLQDSDMDFTILRPNWFMQNFNTGFLLPMIQDAGGTVVSSVSKKTDFLVAGENPGSKLKKAEDNDVEVLDEAELLRMIDG